MQQVLQIYHASINPRFSFHGFTFILLFRISGFSGIISDVSHGSFDKLRYTIEGLVSLYKLNSISCCNVDDDRKGFQWTRTQALRSILRPPNASPRIQSSGNVITIKTACMQRCKACNSLPYLSFIATISMRYMCFMLDAIPLFEQKDLIKSSFLPPL